MRRIAAVVILLALALPSFAQGGPELEALAEAFFAKDLKTLLKHLPPELADAITKASAEGREDFTDRFLLARRAEQEGHVKFTRPEGGPVVLVIEERRWGDYAPAQQAEVYLDKQMFGGNETMLRFRLKAPGNDDFGYSGRTASFYLRYVEGEWRVYEIESDRESVKLDDPKFIARIVRESPRMSANEASAVGSLRTLNTAMVTYASTYPDIGFATSISVLGGEGGTQDAAGLIDSILGSPPYEKNGYRFTLTAVGGSPTTEYQITGRPVKFGVTGSRSFFTDQSGVIRWTNEDRDPTVEDEPLQ